MKILEQIKEVKTLEELEELIRSLFKEEDEEYIPAVINEGRFTVEEGEDFYLKLVIAHDKVNLSKTWLKTNMTLGILDPDWDNKEDIYQKLVENIVTRRNVKGHSLYQLNPLLVGEEIEEMEYDNSIVVNAVYKGGYGSGKGQLILKNDEAKGLLVLKKVIEPFLNEAHTNYYPKYKLVAEYEYRTHNKNIENIETNVYHTKEGIHDIVVDDKGMRIIGSIIIGGLQSKEIEARNIKVVDMGSAAIRSHNPRNYDDDTQAGFVIFKKEVVNILKDEYYIYDLVMLEKDNIQNSVIIDILSDKIVFWEGEYNKLPNEVKDKIDTFNYIPEPIENIISPAMMAWQLAVDWNYDKKLLPNQKLARAIKDKYFNNAVDVGISFYEPNSVEEFREFILKVEKVTSIRLQRFNPEYSDVKNLYKIYSKEDIELSKLEIITLYQKYCYQIYKGIENE